MNILLIGGGGREHALGWKLKQSPSCGKLFFAPGNGGTARIGQNVPIHADAADTKTADQIKYFCRQNDVGLVVIGPEDPLANGLADRLSPPIKETGDGASPRTSGAGTSGGLIVFGPVQAAARLEADKAYAKQLMRQASVPTAEARVFTDADAALAYVHSRETPVVVKASGLAKGKGVVVCDNNDQAAEAVERIMVRKEFGQAGDTVVIEERLVGQEASVLALVDGRNIFVLDPCQDHKQLGEGDTGPNTGGMGAYCPTPVVDDAMQARIEKDVLVPIVDALRRNGVVYRGVLYAGLMITAGGPKVLEFNCRFGDPETQPLMMRLQGDLVEILCATAQGRLDEAALTWDPRPCCCVVMASGGYPGPYPTGKVITGLDAAAKVPEVEIFHAGTAIKDGQLLTQGGRVLNVCALGKDLAEARGRANEACGLIQFEGAYFRRDIGSRVLEPQSRKVPAGRPKADASR